MGVRPFYQFIPYFTLTWLLFTGGNGHARADESTAVAANQAEAPGGDNELFDVQLTGSLGRNLETGRADTSFVFEPLVSFHLSPKQQLIFYSAVDRPTDPHQEFAVPKTLLTYRSDFAFLDGFLSHWRVSLNAVNLHRWSSDGYQVRMGAATELGKELLPGLIASVRIGPYFQASQYSQAANGTNLPRYGFSERVGLDYQYRALEVEAVLIIDQVYNGIWRNDYATTESVAFAIHENMRVGIAHELISSLVDDTTGFYRPVRLLDGRDSRISAFADIIF